MLQKMRSTTGSWFAKGILGFLVLSFLLWGVADYTVGDNRPDVVAVVGDREIGLVEFQAAYDGFLRAQGFNAVEPDIARQLRLGEAVAQSLAERTVFEAEALGMGLTASRNMVRQEIEDLHELEGLSDEIRSARLIRVLQELRMTEESYVERIRVDLARNQLLDAVTAGVSAPEELVGIMRDHYAERRDAVYLALPIASVSEAEAPGDTELQEFYEEFQEEFRRPELRAVTFSLITPEAVADSLEISEEEIASAFERRQSEFEEPERRTVLQALFSSQDEANAAVESLRSAPIDEVEASAEELGVPLLALGSFIPGQLPDQALEEAAFGLSEAGVSDAFEGGFGWSVAVVSEIVEGTAPTLDLARDRIRADLALDRAYEEVFQRGNLLEDGYAQGMTLEEAADVAGHSAVTVEAVDAGGSGPDGASLSGLPDGLLFLETVFDLDEGEVSFLETTESNAMFMARVDQIIPSAIPSLDDVRDDVVELWREDAQLARAEETALYLADRLSGGSDPEVLASFYPDAEAGSIEGMARTGEVPNGTGFPESLAQGLFSLEVGEADYEPFDDVFIIARVTDTYLVEHEEEEALSASLAGILIQGMREDLQQQLGAALLAAHPIEINQDAINYVYDPSLYGLGMGH